MTDLVAIIAAGRKGAGDRRQRADRIGDIVGAMGEGHGASSEYHEDGEHPFDIVKVAAAGLFFLDPPQ